MANRFVWGLRGGRRREKKAARGEGVIVRALARAPRRVPLRQEGRGGEAPWRLAGKWRPERRARRSPRRGRGGGARTLLPRSPQWACNTKEGVGPSSRVRIATLWGDNSTQPPFPSSALGTLRLVGLKPLLLFDCLTHTARGKKPRRNEPRGRIR